jgi:hypothetical protein
VLLVLQHHGLGGFETGYANHLTHDQNVETILKEPFNLRSEKNHT